MPIPIMELFFFITVIRVRKGELWWSWMIKRKNHPCSGMKGKVFSFRLKRRRVQRTPIPQPLMVFVPTSQDTLDHVRKTLIRRELRSWCSVPQKSLPDSHVQIQPPHKG